MAVDYASRTLLYRRSRVSKDNMIGFLTNSTLALFSGAFHWKSVTTVPQYSIEGLKQMTLSI